MTPVLAVLGPTATGKSALALMLAERLGGEIVNCDSTAVYRGFDIGTDKVPVAERRGIPHHLIDIVPPTAEYTAARLRARCRGGDSRHPRARPRADSRRRHRLLLPGADPRACFPAPARTTRCARGWMASPHAAWNGSTGCCGASIRSRPSAFSRATRSGSCARSRCIFQTGKSADRAFRGDGVAAARRCRGHGPGAAAAERRCWPSACGGGSTSSSTAGLLDEVRAISRPGCPESARPFGGLVYRQVLEHLHGVRDEAATRALIAQENRRYARRQLIWFRKEPNLTWFDGPGESPDVQGRVLEWLAGSGSVVRLKELRRDG